MKNNIPEGWESLINRMMNKKGAAHYWELFVHEASQIMVKKDTDYDSRFMKGLIEMDARTIWAWEVDKKLDRIRTWIKRGELQVKEEGIRNSVDDLFIYTVQYVAYRNSKLDLIGLYTLENWKENRLGLFNKYTGGTYIDSWLNFLEEEGRIHLNESLLRLIIRQYMGGEVKREDWKSAIRVLLS